MYGTVYEISTLDWTNGAKFGSSFTWNGTNYKLTNATVTAPDNTHHYSCNLTDENATCASIRYVFYMDGNTKYYITLTGGDGVEEAMMQTNTTNSNAKSAIDGWYANNMTSYTTKLEDTIWCNDRSFGSGNNNGWIANGGDLSTYLYNFFITTPYGYQMQRGQTSSHNIEGLASIRPAISLKHGAKIVGGTGTKLSPYVIE